MRHLCVGFNLAWVITTWKYYSDTHFDSLLRPRKKILVFYVTRPTLCQKPSTPKRFSDFSAKIIPITIIQQHLNIMRSTYEVLTIWLCRTWSDLPWLCRGVHQLPKDQTARDMHRWPPLRGFCWFLRSHWLNNLVFSKVDDEPVHHD